MGYLMEYLLPSYTLIVGGAQNLREHVLATTRSGRDLAAKQRRLGFQVLPGQNDAALARMKPDILLFAPPPDAVPEITRQTLIPYYRQCREHHWPLPELYAFAPSPDVDWYHNQLGADAPAVVCIPRTESGIRDEELTVLCFGQGPAWQGERLERLLRFASPMGGTEILPPAVFYSQLGCRSTANAINHILFTVADCLKAKGLTITHADLAGYIKGLLPPMAGALPAPADVLLPQPLAEALGRITNIFLDTLAAYLAQQGSDPQRGRRRMAARLHANLDLCLQRAQIDIVRQIKCYATMGGISELSLLRYGMLLEDRLRSLFGNYPDLTIDAAFADWLKEQFYTMCQHMTYRAATLHEDLPHPVFGPEHAARLTEHIRQAALTCAGPAAAAGVAEAMASCLTGCPEEQGWAYRAAAVYHAAAAWLSGNLDPLIAGDVISEGRLAFGREYGQGAAYLPVQMAGDVQTC